MPPKSKYHFSHQRLERITQLFHGYLDRNELPHAIALIGKADQIVYKEKFGWQDIENNFPIQFDSIIRIASMTKPVTAVAAMLLYEEGVFDLNTPIHRFLPIFKEIKVLKKGSVNGTHAFEKIQSPITFRHLFTHTSGLSYGGPTGELIDDLYNPVIEPLHTGKREANIQESVEILAGLPLAFQPGTGWRYGLNLDVLGALVEVISGMSLSDFFRERIFTHLGMVDTAFDLAEENRTRLAVLYQRGDKAGELTRQDLPLPLPAFMWGGGGLLSTLEDYGHFAAMLANGGRWGEKQLLSPTTVAMFSQNWAPPETIPVFQATSQEINGGYGYSLGTAVLMDPSPTGKFGHVGEFYWGGAFGTYFFVDPAESLYAVFMTQLNPNWAYPIPWQLKQLIYQAFV